MRISTFKYFVSKYLLYYQLYEIISRKKPRTDKDLENVKMAYFCYNCIIKSTYFHHMHYKRTKSIDKWKMAVIVSLPD